MATPNHSTVISLYNFTTLITDKRLQSIAIALYIASTYMKYVSKVNGMHACFKENAEHMLQVRNSILFF